MAHVPESNLYPIESWFRVVTTVEPDVTIVGVSGDVDLPVAERLTAALLEAIRSAPAVLVDLCECTFMDSTGLGALLTGVRAAKARNVRLGVASAPGGAVRALFDLAVGHGFFSSSDDRASGLAALQATS